MSNFPPSGQFLTASEIAKILPFRVTPETIRVWSHSEKFPQAIKISTRKFLWAVSDVQAWAEDRGLSLPLPRLTGEEEGQHD